MAVSDLKYLKVELICWRLLFASQAEGLSVPLICASPEMLGLEDNDEGFDSGQQVLAAGMQCSACNRLVVLILHHLGAKGAVKPLIVVLGHLLPSFSSCCGCRRAQGKLLCVPEAHRELKPAGSGAAAG